MLTMGVGSYADTLIECRLNLSNVTIGKYCSIARGVVMDCGFNHNTCFISTYLFNVLFSEFKHLKGHPVSKGDIKIGNDVWIGENVLIMSGVTVGDGAVLGAHAVVTKDVDSYAIVAGVPAKRVKWRFPADVVEKLLQVKWWDWDVEKIKRHVPLLMSGCYKVFFDAVAAEEKLCPPLPLRCPAILRSF